jgi:2-keto-4-pentenoate hydratase/2-oxohepta-3-ene-1,7-dioic acid hydratase in catechol pathway
MLRMMWTVTAALAVGALWGASPVQAQPASSAVAEPFKLGTFRTASGEPFVGIVLRDSIVIDAAAANKELLADPHVPAVQLPADMKGIISAYEYGVQRRLYDIVNWAVRANLVSGPKKAYWVHDVASIRTLPPILYPSKMLNAAANYYAHAGEASGPEEAKKIEENLRKNRGTPYLFLKPTVGAIIGQGDDFILPKGRERIDWECEIGVVIGKPAKNVSAADAKNYVFGYTIQLDMSDRGARPGETGPSRFGSDWYMGKGHDTFAPLGPYIVPKEFYGDVQNVRQLLTVNGKAMQDARSTDMIHNISELIEYGSSVMTLFPGDVIAAGSPAGTGMSRTVRTETIFLKDGDKIEATIDGIGTLKHTARREGSATPPGAPR